MLQIQVFFFVFFTYFHSKPYIRLVRMAKGEVVLSKFTTSEQKKNIQIAKRKKARSNKQFFCTKLSGIPNFFFLHWVWSYTKCAKKYQQQNCELIHKTDIYNDTEKKKKRVETRELLRKKKSEFEIRWNLWALVAVQNSNFLKVERTMTFLINSINWAWKSFLFFYFIFSHTSCDKFFILKKKLDLS
jgi:hypothetical protein